MRVVEKCLRRGENCDKSFSTKFNTNKHVKLKKHGPPADVKTTILLNEKSLHHYPKDGTVESKYKQNILKHLKSRDSLKKGKLLPITRCVQFVPKYLHRNPTLTDTLQNANVQILILLTSVLNQLKTKQCSRWCFPLISLLVQKRTTKMYYRQMNSERVKMTKTFIPGKSNLG